MKIFIVGGGGSTVSKIKIGDNSKMYTSLDTIIENWVMRLSNNQWNKEESITSQLKRVGNRPPIFAYDLDKSESIYYMKKPEWTGYVKDWIENNPDKLAKAELLR